MLKRIFAFLLAMVLLVGAIPMASVHVHAEDAEEMILEELQETEPVTEETEPVTEETEPVTEETEPVTEETEPVTEETEPVTEETEPVTEETEPVTEETKPVTEETEPVTEETEPVTEETEPVTEETEPVTEETEPVTEEEQLVLEEEFAWVFDEEYPTNEELFAGFVEQQFYDYEIATFGTIAGSRLSGVDKQIYDYMVKVIKQIANGERTNTKVGFGETVKYNGVTYTPEVSMKFNDMNVNYGRILKALLDDLPYEQYWFDKIDAGNLSAIYYTKNGSPTRYAYIGFHLNVADDYRNGTNDYQTNSQKTSAACQAAANARAIVSQYANYADYDKLVAYGNYICSQVTYDHDAVNNNANSYNNAYYKVHIDAWQMISAFDNNPNTNIVCEGYAKAFEYLCEMSTFREDVECYGVHGTMKNVNTGKGGGHMWNIVKFNGKNYLVDVTNSDVGQSMDMSRGLFMVGTSGSITGGYVFANNRFTYYDWTIDLYGSGSDSILNLCGTNYHVHNLSWNTTAVATCTQNGTKTGTCTVYGCGYSKTESIPAFGHNYVNNKCQNCGGDQCTHSFQYFSTQTKATCVATGVDIHKCSKCGETKTVVTDVNPKNHSYVKSTVKPTVGKKGYDLYTCSDCGDSYKKNYKDALGLKKPTVYEYVLATSGKPYLEIKPVTGAEKYYVYRATSKSGSYKHIGTTTKTRSDNGYYFYEDTKASVGKTYYYKVKAATDDVKSSYSSAVAVRCICAQPVLSKWYIDSDSGKLKMKWSKVSGAKKYEIYRATSKNGTYKKIKTTTGTSFTDSTGSVGKTYYYKLKAIASSSKNNSTTKYFEPYYGARICAKADLSVKVGSSGYPYLSWDKVSGAGKYEIYRFDDAQATTGGVYLGYTTGTSWSDKTTEFGKTYYYGVRVRGKTEATDNGLFVEDLVKRKVTCATPSVSVKLSSNKPKLSWKAIPYAQEYAIYRSTKSSSGFTKIGTTTGTSYKDTKAKKGKTYYYKVKAIGPTSDTTSSYSSVDKIKSK